MIIEIQRNPQSSTKSDDAIRELVENYLKEKAVREVYDDFKSTDLDGVVNRIVVDKSDRKIKSTYFMYYVNTDGAGNELIETDSTTLNAAQISTLPSSEFEGVWENLHFDSDIKQNLLEYSSKALLFADRHVDHNVISWNKIILLYGPPGTGKTSICKGIAQKLAIRWTSRFRYSHFIEINAHSLFSKFFSESGKLVLQMFEKIIDIASDQESLVFLLIDEVESLAHSRAAAASGNEPSDAIRVVNALLTQLDRLKILPNVLILTTSNVETSIDGAFVDRADLSVYIGHPSLTAVAKILNSCITELVKRELLEDKAFGDNSEYSGLWTEICRLSVGISGRCLRKLPLLAFNEGQNTIGAFLESLLKIVKSKTAEKKFTQAQQMFQSISLV